MDFTKKQLPSSIMVGGRYYEITTDYRDFINFDNALKRDKKDINLESLDFMYKGEIPEDRQAGLLALIDFMTPPHVLPRILKEDEGQEQHEAIIDYNIDADLIYSAFMQQYGIDLIDVESLHWWKFLALLQGLQSCKLTDVIEFRQYEPNGKNDDYDKQRQKLKRQWELKTDEERALEDEALQEFNNLIGGQ